MAEFVRERLYSLSPTVCLLDPNLVPIEMAFAVCPAGQIGHLYAKPKGGRDINEATKVAIRVVSGESKTHLRRQIAVGLGQVEHRDRSKTPNLIASVVVLTRGRSTRLQRGKDPDGLLALAHLTARLAPGSVTGNFGRCGKLCRDEKGVR
jgi:hypothetical protein